MFYGSRASVKEGTKRAFWTTQIRSCKNPENKFQGPPVGFQDIPMIFLDSTMKCRESLGIVKSTCRGPLQYYVGIPWMTAPSLNIDSSWNMLHYRYFLIHKKVFWNSIIAPIPEHNSPWKGLNKTLKHAVSYESNPFQMKSSYNSCSFIFLAISSKRNIFPIFVIP